MKRVKNKIKGGFVATIGYLLSPLSWWNDIFVNIPMAYVFALPFGFISARLFMPMMVLGYWLTNVLGFMMMHHGAKNIVSEEKKVYTKKEIIKDVLGSLLYTLVVVVMIKLGWIKFPMEYFNK